MMFAHHTLYLPVLLLAITLWGSGCGYMDTDMAVSDEEWEESLSGTGEGRVGGSCHMGGLGISGCGVAGHGVARRGRPGVGASVDARAGRSATAPYALYGVSILVASPGEEDEDAEEEVATSPGVQPALVRVARELPAPLMQ